MDEQDRELLVTDYQPTVRGEQREGASRRVGAGERRTTASRRSRRLSTEKEAADGSFARAATGAIAGAMLGSIPWAVAYSQGWVFGVLGFLIGFCAVKGYTLLKGQTGRTQALIVIVAIVIGLLFGQIAGDILTIIKMINNGSIVGSTMADIPSIYILAIKTAGGAYFRSALLNLGLGLICAVFAAWRVISLLFVEEQAEE